MLCTPAIEYGDEPRNRWVFPFPVTAFDPDVVSSQMATTVTNDGLVESTFWHMASTIEGVCPKLNSWDRAAFMGHFKGWLGRGKSFRFYPDYRMGRYWNCTITVGWLPKWVPIAGNTVFSLAFSFRREDVTT